MFISCGRAGRNRSAGSYSSQRPQIGCGRDGGMTMNMSKTFGAAAVLAVLACSAAHAQVLGGGVGGAVNGALGGGLRDTSVFGNGNATGTLGGELDTGSMIERTRGAAEQTTGRARNVGTNVRNRAESSVATARDGAGRARNA